jgi:hypothetical protein
MTKYYSDDQKGFLSYIHRQSFSPLSAARARTADIYGFWFRLASMETNREGFKGF